ncbi:MAG: HIT family protein [Acidimicrobiales bacterium]
MPTFDSEFEDSGDLMECGSCRSLAGELVLTSAPRIDLDQYWRVEHCHPVAVAGWLVLILRRHARAIHELSDDEAAALGKWLPALSRALHDATGCELEYVMQFAEGHGFPHVHFHLVARSHDWPTDFKGPAVFAAFGVPDPIAPAAATLIIERVSRYIGVPATPIAV